MKRNALFMGIIFFLVGGYLFAYSMIMIISGALFEDWGLWTIYLTLGIIFLSIGPGIIVWGFTKDYQESQSRLTNHPAWQTIRIPSACVECGNEVAVHSLEWIGPDEARCPFCSNRIEVIKDHY